MERLRKSFRRKKNKNNFQSENGFDIQAVFAGTDEVNSPEMKTPSRLQKLRASIRIKKKKKEATDVIEIPSIPCEDVKEENPPEDTDSLPPFEKNSKFRFSLKRKKNKSDSVEKSEEKPKKGNSKWETDDERVRSNHCEFKVKYLGNMEVAESRGMEVCEEAIRSLRAAKQKKVKGVLHVSGDGLRVVDSKTRGMLVDQVIEKVSFCAPDRGLARGFAYISRDGTSRRWLCHGFLSRKDTGERLSHAVGVAFAVCLEKKQAREREGVTATYDEEEGTFTRFGSFRQGTLTERLCNPQEFKESAKKVEVEVVENPFAIARPRPGDARASMRGLGEIKGASPFKRGGQEYSSLRLNELPSNVSRREKSRVSLILEETFENEETKNEINEMILKMSQAKVEQDISEEKTTEALSHCSTSGGSFSDLPGLAAVSPGPLTTFTVPAATTLTSFNNNNESVCEDSPVEQESPEQVNPWDLVPDQPKTKQKLHSRSNSKSDSKDSSQADKWLASLTTKISSLEENSIEAWKDVGETPVDEDTEWAAIATRNIDQHVNNNQTNPFTAFV